MKIIKDYQQTKYNLTLAPSRSIKYAVVHNTATLASAKNNCIYFSGGNRNASADFFVDQDGTIYQFNANIRNYYSWHCGDRNASGIINKNSIGIEFVSDGCEFTVAQKKALKELIAYLRNEFGVTEVVRHYDASGKSCPAFYVNEGRWNELKNYIVSTSGTRYRAHVENIGWQDWRSSGEMAGTEGQALRLEALQIDAPFEILAKAHIQDIGWVDYGKINKDTVIGTVGQSKRLECLCLKGNFKYRVHIQNEGWSAWTNADGIATLGTVGQALRIEAIQFEEI